MTLELENVDNFELGFNQVQALRDLLDSVLSLGSYCKGALRVLRVLQGNETTGFSGLHSSLDVYSAQLLDCVESVSVLRSRISNLIDLVRPLWDLELVASLTVTVRLRSGCQKSIHGHRNEQGNGNTHEKDQLSYGKNSRSR